MDLLRLKRGLERLLPEEPRKELRVLVWFYASKAGKKNVHKRLLARAAVR